MTDTRINLNEQYITAETDLNTLTETGVYHFKTSPVNGPTSSWGTLFVDFDVGTPYQIYIPDNVATAYKRNYSGGSWGSWSEMFWESGNTTATNNTSYMSGGSFDIRKRGKTVHINASGVAFKAYSGRQTVATVPEGYRPAQTAYGNFNGVASPYIIINTSGTIQVDGTGSAHTNWGWACYVVP